MASNLDAYEYESEVLEYVVPESVHKYTPDFKLPNGVYVETKGIFSVEDRKKMALVIEQHPDKDIRILFQRNNKISKKSKTHYSDWCYKRGIICHVSPKGLIPEDWLK